MPSKKRTQYLWTLVIERGLAETQEVATRLIMSGKVHVNGNIIDKAGYKVPSDSDITIKGIDQKYVSKGGNKLEGALSDFNVKVSERVAIDVGASTGGFADCLLQQNVAKVYAVDAGYGQLSGKLRCDSRVINLERTNISDVKVEDLDPVPDIAVVDLSYLSLKVAIPVIVKLMQPKSEIICLVKPLFEVKNNVLRRTGKIDDDSVYHSVLNDLAESFYGMGHNVVGISHSHITGSRGTREFFMHLLVGRQQSARTDVYMMIENAVDAAVNLAMFGRSSQA